jgi:hypothetical protein
MGFSLVLKKFNFKVFPRFYEITYNLPYYLLKPGIHIASFIKQDNGHSRKSTNGRKEGKPEQNSSAAFSTIFCELVSFFSHRSKQNLYIYIRVYKEA